MTRRQELWLFLSKNLTRLSRRLRLWALPAIDGSVTGSSRWLPTAEDIALEQYVQEACKHVRGQKCNEKYLREIETTGGEPISDTAAPNYRRQVVAALELARTMPVSTRGCLGASHVVPDLVMRIDENLNGDPVERGVNKPDLTRFERGLLLRDRYICEVDKYLAGQKANEKLMREVETSGRSPVPEQDTDAFRRYAIPVKDVMLRHPYFVNDPRVATVDEKVYACVDKQTSTTQEV